jgi:hypothetical protein
VIELGLIGLAAFTVLITKFLIVLWRFGPRTRLVFFVTIALLATSATQETLYPVAAQGHFLGLFSVIAALSLRIGIDSEAVENSNVTVTFPTKTHPAMAYST